MKIEKNIPIPTVPSVTRKPKYRKDYNYSEMEVGDSIFFENMDYKKANSKVGCMRTYLKRREIDYRFIVRQEGNGFRIWRVK